VTARERPVLLRVERGAPDVVDLAVLTTVLLVRMAVASSPSAPRHARARWHRAARGLRFDGPRAWRRAQPTLTLLRDRTTT
jgi:hypothetical protein